MGILIWALLTLAIVLSYDLLSFVWGRRGWQRLLSTFFLFYAQVIATEFVLGLLGLLSRWSVVIVNILVTVFVILVVRNVHGDSVYRKYIDSTFGSVKEWMNATRKDPLFLALLVLAIGLLGWIMFLALLFPVTDVDGNAYHLSFIAQAIQSHNVYGMPTSISWLAGYPKGGELIEMWNVIVANNDLMANLSQIPFLLLGIVSLYGVSLRLGVSKRDARFSSVLFLFLPIVINQAKTTYVDLIFCALFFAAVAIVTTKKLSKLDLVLAGIAFSLLISVKSTGLLFVAACLPFLLANILVFRKGRIAPDYRKYVVSLLLVAAPTVFGLFWYAKDLIQHGSPLYPFGLNVLGVSIFPGQNFQDFIAGAFSNFSVMPAGSLARVWFVWTEQKDWFGCLYNYDSTFSGLGPLWFTLLVPSIIIAIILAIKRRHYLFLSLTGVLGALFLLYPANFYTRYTMFIALIGVAAFGLICTAFGGAMRTFARVVALGLALIVIGTTFTLCNFTPAAIDNQIGVDRTGDRRSGLVYQSSVGAAYTVLQSKIKAGETVVYDSSPYYIYPLWKSDFSNKVIYIPAKNKAEWYTKVKQDGVKYIFTGITSKEHGWAQQNKAYRVIYKDDVHAIYQVY